MRRIALPTRQRLSRAFRAFRLRPPAAPIVVLTEAATARGPAGGAAFDGRRAFGLLEAQCREGPRIPGTEGHRRTLELLRTELARSVDVLAVQRWEQPIRRGPGAGRRLPMTNLFGLLRGAHDPRVAADRVRPALMLCAHWDTRPVADQDPDPRKRGLPVPGANDGASGVAVLLEVARALRAQRPAISIVFAFWDGEDLGEYYYGSRLFAAHCARPGFERWRPRRAVLLDMVGGAGLRCTAELNSLSHAPGLWNDVHDAVRRLGLDRHFHGAAQGVNDDHMMLNRAGIPSIVLIDYSYPYWHTASDTVERCSAESLQIVGDVVLRFVHDHPALPEAAR
jgi:hypothetical protein